MSKTVKTKKPHHAGPVTADGDGIRWVMLIYFFSGVCSLIDEVVWVRLLKLTLGNTVYASSIVVSMFMAGLALGALIMARYADRITRRLRLYALLELCAAVSALSLPWALQFVDGAYRWFFANYQPAPTALLFIQLIISAAVLLVPSMIMGSTLPLLAGYVTALQNRVGRLVGRLYALNMLGAAFGCFLAGFVLIRMLGVMGTLYIAAAVNVLVAFAGWTLSRSHDIAATTPAKEPAKQRCTTEQVLDTKRYLLMLAFFTSGFVSIGYELIWMRSIVFLLKGFTYVFSAVLTIYLLGNVLGAWIGSRLAKRLKKPAVGFGISLTSLGILGTLYIPWFVLWHSKAMPKLTSSFAGLLEIPDVAAMLWPMLHTTFLFLLPAVTMGIGFPLALQAWSNYRHKVGQTTGTVYGVNTIGAVLGGLVTGFLLIPFIGVQLSITVLGLLAIWLGTMMMLTFSPSPAAARRLAHLVPASALTIAAILIPSDLFSNRLVAARIPDTELLAVREGITTTVSVHRKAGLDLILAASGTPVAGDHLYDVQKVLGHLGILLNKNTTDVLSVGFGSGQTALCMSLHDLENIDVVEISPELVDVALEFFTHINLGDRLDEEVNMIYMDAKNYIHLTPKRYDLIINDCIDPKAVADNASLYTKEYFQRALEHLKPTGMFASYLPIMSVPIPCLESIIGTFAEVFPHVTIWFPTTTPSGHDFFYLVGTNRPQLFSINHIDNELSRQTVRQSAEHINFRNSHYVLSCYIGDENDLKKCLRQFSINSDYAPYIEFSTGINETPSLKRQWFLNLVTGLRQSGSIFKHIDWTGLPQDRQQSWRSDYESFHNVATHLLKSRMESNAIARLRNCFDGLKIMPQHASLIKQEDDDLIYVSQDLITGRLNPGELMTEMNTLLSRQPDFGAAWLIKSWLAQLKNDIHTALSAAEKAAQYSPNTPAAHENLANILFGYRRLDKAFVHYSKAAELMPNQPSLHFSLGMVCSYLNRLDEATGHFHRGLKIMPDNTKARLLLADILTRQGRKDEAAEQYRQILKIDPINPEAQEGLKEMLAE